ncbi:MAG: hypothetical protein IPJ01_10120 [Micavibrio sp.]|nr:hypothetical protein [Micavibrio sp.]
MKNQKVYVVGNVTNLKNGAWKIVGVFTKELDAVKNCIDENHFVGLVELNKVYKKDQKWKGAYYPKLESKPKAN